MTAADDDPYEMAAERNDANRLHATGAEAVLAGGPVPEGFGEVAGLLSRLRALADLPAPVPNPALAALLTGTATRPVGQVPAVVDLASRRRRTGARTAATVALAGVLSLGSVGVAAAHGRLPDRAQDAVASTVAALTPFSVPASSSDRPAPPSRSLPPAVTTPSVPSVPPPTSRAGVPGPVRLTRIPTPTPEQSAGGIGADEHDVTDEHDVPQGATAPAGSRQPAVDDGQQKAPRASSPGDAPAPADSPAGATDEGAGGTPSTVEPDEEAGVASTPVVGGPDDGG